MDEFENPVFDEDDYDEEGELDTNNEFNRTIQNLSTHIQGIGNDVDTRTKLIVEQKQSIVKEYYKLIKEKYGLIPVRIDITNFDLGPDNKTLFLKDGDKDIQLTLKRGNGFISLSTLAKEIGIPGIRDLLSLPDYTSKTKSLSAKAVASLQNVENNLPDVDNIEMTDLPNAAETAVKEIETSFIDLNETGTQTDMTKREMDGIIKAMTSVKEEIANELAKLNETNKHIAKEKENLDQAKADNDEFQIERISSRIKDLEA